MSAFSVCCDPVGTGKSSGGTTTTLANVGTGADVYVNGSGPNPFNLRTIESSDASVIVVQTATTIDLTVAATPPATAINIGAFAQLYVAGSSSPFEFRTIQSSDASIGISQNASDIDLTSIGSAASATNVGTGQDHYVTGSSSPFEFRRSEVIDDATQLHGRGNLAFSTDLNTVKVDLPRAHVQSSASLTINNILTPLIDTTFSSDIAGANVAGQDGEDWILWWSLKIQGDPGFPTIDQVARLEVFEFGFWVIKDTIHARAAAGLNPAWPMSRNILLSGTEWSAVPGLRCRILVATNHFSVFAVFNDPSLTIMRYNKAP